MEDSCEGYRVYGVYSAKLTGTMNTLGARASNAAGMYSSEVEAGRTVPVGRLPIHSPAE